MKLTKMFHKTIVIVLIFTFFFSQIAWAGDNKLNPTVLQEVSGEVAHKGYSPKEVTDNENIKEIDLVPVVFIRTQRTQRQQRNAEV